MMRAAAAAASGLLVLGCGGSEGDEPATPVGDGRVPLPALSESSPADGASDVPRTEWIVLRFAEAPKPEALEGFELSCDGAPQRYAADPLGADRVVVNPSAELPPDSACTLAWRAESGTDEIAFGVAGQGEPAVVSYDRDDATNAAPFPDDFWLEEDATTTTGRRVVLPALDRPDDVKQLLDVLGESTKHLDGFSPLAPFVVELPEAADLASIPLDAAQSLDPLATVGLFDLDPDSESHGQRLPFYVVVQDGESADGTPAHHLLVFPGMPLAARGRYALAVTRRALIDPTRPFEASAFFARVTEPDGALETAAEQRAAPLASEVLQVLEATSPPIRRDDVAVAVSASIRSTDQVTRDRLSIRQQLLDAAPPSYGVDSVEPESDAASPVAAIVEGTWTAPSFRDGSFVSRDSDGLPAINGTADAPFVLALPRAAESGPVPIVIYQHGMPGSAEREVPLEARGYLAEAGFAVIGFTDIPNRELTGGTDASAYALALFGTVIAQRKIPEYLALLPNAEQLAFLRLIPELGSLDVLPAGAPDGKPDLDVTAPLAYVGISQGSFRGTGLVAYAPEIRAAALVVGAGRWSTTLVHQAIDSPVNTPIYPMVAQYYPNVRLGEYWMGIAIAQMAADDQDELMQAEYLYRRPLDLGTDARPSVLATEGLADSFVPHYATRASAAAFGLPQLDPAAEAVPFLERVQGPLQGNLASETTGAFFQYVPKSHPALEPTPGCKNQAEGHFCAQDAEEARRQRLHFFESALGGTPEIIDPFSE